jgi:signal transduction histidine kinase
VASLCESKNLTIVPQIASGLLQFPGDENKLCRTLVNLLGNAIKFTPGGGTLIAEARLSQDRLSENGQSIVFSVSDTGEGIPVEAFDHIFEKFGQVPSRQGGRMMSTGLGLTFCKLAVEAHGGHIGVESVLGQGSTFCFTVPLTPLEQQARLE